MNRSAAGTQLGNPSHHQETLQTIFYVLTLPQADGFFSTNPLKNK